MAGDDSTVLVEVGKFSKRQGPGFCLSVICPMAHSIVLFIYYYYYYFNLKSFYSFDASSSFIFVNIKDWNIVLCYDLRWYKLCLVGYFEAEGGSFLYEFNSVDDLSKIIKKKTFLTRQCKVYKIYNG